MATFCYGGPSGGLGGDFFDDGQTGNHRLIEVVVYAGSFIDSIQTVYDYLGQRVEKPKRGGNGGMKKVLKLAADEHITEIGGRHGWWIDSLWIKTSKGNVEKWGGNGGSRDFYYHVPTGTVIYGFFGYAGRFVDAVGVITLTS